MEYAVLALADRWHLHPADVDPTSQRPARARWFWWAIDMLQLERAFAPKAGKGQ